MNSSNNVLIINQDKVFLDYLIGVLQPAGYTIHTAMEMRSALSVLSKHPVGLIICGKELQDISGYDFLRFLKNDPLRENIPLMFLVSIKNQGRPFKAFELGAVDFLVYPIEPDTLISRIDEVLKQASQKKDGLHEKIAPPEKPQCAPQEEKPLSPEKPLPNLQIDVTRDGVIWLPGIVKSFGRQELFLETSLFGKPGVRLMLRFKFSDGMFIANSRIKDIAFDDFQKPAGIAVNVEEDGNWRRIYANLEKTVSAADSIPQAEQNGDIGAHPAEDIQKTIAMPQPEMENQDISGTQLIEAAEKKQKATYDIRFYYSLIGKQMDNYRAISLIGAGNMGGVLQGWDVALEREVALKIISYELSSKEEFRDMFIKEARVVSRLNHPNIAQIYSIGNSNEILYYAMEFIDGETLKDILGREGKLDSMKGLEYLLTICEALDFVFHSSVIHRDIKPANIMFNNFGILKLVDFGVAISTETKTGGFNQKSIMGSPLYMSPEQIAGLALDHRSDMYSVGATFYHAFCGSPPFESEEYKEVLEQHLTTHLVPLKERNSKLAPDLCSIVEKMLAKDPNDRFKDFQAIITELKTLRSRISTT